MTPQEFFLAGIRVRQSPLAVNVEPVRRHRQRRGQSATYHRRVQKKWLKRFGKKEVPCAYVIDAGLACGKTLIVHPSMMERLLGLTS